MKINLRVFSVAALLLLISCAQNSPSSGSCASHLRALLDVGSGSTKLNLSEVSICDSNVRVVRVLDDQSSVDLPLEAGKDSRGALSPEVQTRGLAVIQSLRDKAVATAQTVAPKFKTIEFAAVGTQAFRTATNAQEFAARVQTLGITLVALPQQREGEFGYLGVKQKGAPETCKGREILVWDVGGGSMQLTTVDAKGTFQVQALKFGAEFFKMKLIHDLHLSNHIKSCPSLALTPNPIGWKNSSRAETLAQDLAQGNLPKDYQVSNITQCVVGIGGVHAKAIEASVSRLWPKIKSCTCGSDSSCTHHENSYTKKELQCLGLWLSDKNDCDPDLKGPYSTTAVSNIYLILGFMERLKLNQVEVMNVSMGTNLVQDTTTLKWSSIPIPSKEK